VHDPVDEQGGRDRHLTRSQSTLDIATDASQHRGARPVAVEQHDIKLDISSRNELDRVLPNDSPL
jgi:hypothetical protein